MSTATAHDRIIDILKLNSELSGNGHVFVGTQQEVNLYPAFLVFAGPAEHSKPSVDQKLTVRDFDIIGLIQPMEQGREGDAERAVRPWLDTIPDLFDPRPGLWLQTQLDGIDGVHHAYLLNDTGFTAINMAGADHAGCIWKLRVEIETYLDEGA